MKKQQLFFLSEETEMDLEAEYGRDDEDDSCPYANFDL